jgi:hypothetical protein
MERSTMPSAHNSPPLRRASIGYHVVRWVLGFVLLGAALLKLNGLSAGPVARMGVFSTPEFQVAVVQFEFFLALWLLSGKHPLGS